MGALPTAINDIMHLAHKLSVSTPEVLLFTLAGTLLVAIRKIPGLILAYTINRSTKYGRLEAVAVAYKVLYCNNTEGLANLSPEQALSEIRREIERE